MLGVRIAKSILIGGGVAFVPWLPWYRLGDGVQTAVSVLLLPGFLIDYLFTGQNGMNINRITALNCVIYSAAVYVFLKRRLERKNPDAS